MPQIDEAKRHEMGSRDSPNHYVKDDEREHHFSPHRMSRKDDASNAKGHIHKKLLGARQMIGLLVLLCIFCGH
jgi:hypothetical protein